MSKKRVYLEDLNPEISLDEVLPVPCDGLTDEDIEDMLDAIEAGALDHEWR